MKKKIFQIKTHINFNLKFVNFSKHHPSRRLHTHSSLLPENVSIVILFSKTQKTYKSILACDKQVPEI